MRIELDARVVRDLQESRAVVADDKPTAVAHDAEPTNTLIQRSREFPLMGRQTKHPNIGILSITRTLCEHRLRAETVTGGLQYVRPLECSSRGTLLPKLLSEEVCVDRTERLAEATV